MSKASQTHVFFDARMAGMGGIGTYIEKLVQLFAQNLGSLSMRIVGNETRLRALTQNSCSNVEIVHCPCRVFSLAEQWQLPKLARDCLIYHAPHYNVPVLRNANLLITLHDVLHWDMPQYVPSMTAKVFLAAMSTKIARAKIIVTDSEFSRTRILSHFNIAPQQVIKIPLAADEQFFYVRDAVQIAPTLAKHALDYKNYILFVRNMKPHKNIERLVSAFEMARHKLPRDMKLVFVGKFDSLRMRVDVSKLDVLHIPNVVNAELAQLYSGARALAFVSLYEGFGLPPLEAMLCGCPVLASREGAVPEVCADAALYADAYDVEDIASGLIKISLDTYLQTTLIEKAILHAQSFNWLNTARKTIEIYKLLMEVEK